MPVDTVARCRAIANAIVTDINTEIAAKQSDGTPISPARFTAAVNYYPEYTIAQLADLKVDIRFFEATTEGESRAGIAGTTEIEITVQKAIRYTETAAISLLVDIAARIAKFYQENEQPCGAESARHASMVTALGSGHPIRCAASVHTIYDPVRLHDYGHFWSMIATSWQEFVSS